MTILRDANVEERMVSANRYPGIDPRIVRCVRHHAARVAAALPGIDVEDVEQELMLHVHRRLPHFDPMRGSLRTFADRVARNRVANLAQAARSQKRGFGVELLPLEPAACDADDRRQTSSASEREASGQEHDAGYSSEAFLNLRIDLWRAYNRLPATLRSCFLGLFDNTITDAARRAGVSRATVYDRIAAIRARFREVDLQAYAAEPDTFEVFSVSDQ